MKTLRELQNQIKPNDYEIIGKALELSPETVRKIAKGKRKDIDKRVTKALNMLVKHRAESDKIIITRIRNHNLQAA